MPFNTYPVGLTRLTDFSFGPITMAGRALRNLFREITRMATRLRMKGGKFVMTVAKMLKRGKIG